MENQSNENKSRPFLRVLLTNIVLALAGVTVLGVVANFALKKMTDFGEIVEVPDFTNMTVNDAEYEASVRNLRIDVVDSVHVRRMGRGLVYSQNPKPGTGVKANRRILLTINSVNAKKVQMPDLTGLSMRQAKAELSSRGLRVGKLVYVDDMATNNVLRQVYRSREIKPGTNIESGSEITLVVGLNRNDSETYIPDVKGLKYLRAVDVVNDNSLNVGRLVFDKSIRTYSDSLDAVVTRQTPEPSAEEIFSVQKGTEITLYLSKDEIKK